MLVRICAILYASVFSCIAVFSQTPDRPIKWGEISKSDLEMKSYPADTNASAVILCDYGEAAIDNSIGINTFRHVRIKILNTKGYEHGTEKIRLSEAASGASISEIEGATYSLKENGEIVKKELQKSDIYKEKLTGDLVEYKFTMPGLTPGCVIEFRYKIDFADLWDMPDWSFQTDEPVRWSEFRMKVPNVISYAIITHGYEPLAINELNEDSRQNADGELRAYTGKTIITCNEYRWAGKDMPAIRDEPFMTTSSDYINRLEFQLAAYALPDGGVKKILNNWDTFVEDMLKNKRLGKAVDDTRTMEKLAAQITEGITDTFLKLQAIYNWVARSIVYDGSNRVFIDKDVDDIVEEKKGSNAEINIVLMSLLKCAGIESWPVILSTRQNGRVQDLFPIISQFNYLLAAAQVDSQMYYLDATNSMRPLEMLPGKVLNAKALVMRNKNYFWVALSSSCIKSVSSYAMLKVDEEGQLQGTITDSCRQYAALGIRRELESKKVNDVAKEQFEIEQYGVNIDSVKILNKDSLNLPVIVSAVINSSSYAMKSGDIIYINPHLSNRIKESPFKMARRTYPIDFENKLDVTSSTTICIPPGFVVKSKPNDRDMKAANETLQLKRTVQVNPESITVTTRFRINSMQIEPRSYERVKDFYNRAASAMAEQIVLVKQAAVAPAPAGGG